MYIILGVGIAMAVMGAIMSVWEDSRERRQRRQRLRDRLGYVAKRDRGRNV